MSQVDAFKSDSFLVSLADIRPHELEANRRFIANARPLVRPPKTALWFMPWTDNAIRGGVRTIFMLADFMSRIWGTDNIFVVDDVARKLDTKPLSESLGAVFRQLRFSIRHFDRRTDEIDDLPESDIAVCTLWTTAYLLARYSKCLRKYYLVQDFEPLFYPAGSVSGCIEATYRFGFEGIANTRGVYEAYARYGNRAMYFTPGVDLAVFNRNGRTRSSSGPMQIVFYGRPNNARNGFALAAAILKRVKRSMGDAVRIVAAGAEWRPSEFGLDRVVENAGNLTTLHDVADLYRQSDLGLAFMFTPHPSYQPLEFMACGCVPVVNFNPSNEWLLKPGRNCLTVEAIPKLAAADILNLIRDPGRMGVLIEAGSETVRALEWEPELRGVAEFIFGNGREQAPG